MYPNQRPADSERRVARRHPARLAGRVAGKSQTKRLCIIRNLSSTGALLLMRSRPELGESVHLEILLDPDESKAHTAAARVVRVEPLGPGHRYPWSVRAALKFEKPVADVLGDLQALADKQARLGIIAAS